MLQRPPKDTLETPICKAFIDFQFLPFDLKQNFVNITAYNFRIELSLNVSSQIAMSKQF